MDEKSGPTSVRRVHVKVFPGLFRLPVKGYGQEGKIPCAAMENQSPSAADVLVITGGGSDLEQVRPWSYTVLVKADPPSIIFLASHSFKDNLDPKALMQPEDM